MYFCVCQISEMFKKADNYFLTEVADNLKAQDCKGQIIEFFVKYVDFNISNGIEAVKNTYTAENKMFITKGRGMQKVIQNIIEKGQDKGEISVVESVEEMRKVISIMVDGFISCR